MGFDLDSFPWMASFFVQHLDNRIARLFQPTAAVPRRIDSLCFRKSGSVQYGSFHAILSRVQTVN